MAWRSWRSATSNIFDQADIWPLFIAVPGLAIFVLGLVLPNSGMIIGGAWSRPSASSWAGRVRRIAVEMGVPGPVPHRLGHWLIHRRDPRREPRTCETGGLWQIVIGTAMFAAFYLFFEQVIPCRGASPAAGV